VSRMPTEKELEKADSHRRAGRQRPKKPHDAIADVFWALINSTESFLSLKSSISRDAESSSGARSLRDSGSR